MARRVFTVPERYGIWLAHKQSCWICRTPVSYIDMQVEHIIPADLKNRQDELHALIEHLGLPSDFQIESYENWRPSHHNCNRDKADIPFDAPFIAVEIAKGRKASAEAKQLAEKVVSDRKLESAFATILTAVKQGKLKGSDVEAALNIYSDSAPAEDVRISAEVVFSEGELVAIRQPFGVGYGPAGPNIPMRMRCGVCGNPYFNGSRCTLCGNMDNE